MSKRDPRWQELRWSTIAREPNTVVKAVGIDTVYFVVYMGGCYLALGLNDPEQNAKQYFLLSDAYSVCQLDHEARLKEWMK